jgi:Flp pilus assembly protein TadB
MMALSSDPVSVEAKSDDLDARQEELMTSASSEWRPPHRKTRLKGWRWLAGAAIVLVLGVTTWAALDGVKLHEIGILAAFSVILMVAAVPVWGAGLLRGREERAARHEAEVEQEAESGGVGERHLIGPHL